MPRTRVYPGTQAVLRAISLLEAFTDERPDWGLSDLARQVGLNKTTAHRLLSALVGRGMVAREPRTGAYRLGPEAIALGARALRTSGLRAASRPQLEALARDTRETSTLEVLVGGDVLILDEVQGPHLLGPSQSVGTRWPAHATSTGKVLLAWRDARGTGADPGGGALAGFTERTLTTTEALADELERVRGRGWATAVEELEPGYVAVGAPVRDLDGRAVAALSVGGPTHRIPSERIPALAVRVRGAADAVSSALGWHR